MRFCAAAVALAVAVSLPCGAEATTTQAMTEATAEAVTDATTVATTVATTGATTGGDDDRTDGRVLATITDERVTESSGLVQSTRDAALAYTVNDSGSAPVVFVIELSSGDVVGTATLGGTSFVDAEALAIGADRRLYVADIGDNDGVRRHVDLYAVGQPGRGDTTVSAVRHRLRYADGPRDAESLISDVVDGSFYIVSKGLFAGGLYRLDRLRRGEITLARPVDDVAVPGLATDADSLGERGGAVVRTYSDAYVFAVPGWALVDSFDLPKQRQGETVAVLDGGPRILVGTEGLPSDLREVSVSRPAWRELAGRPKAAPEQDQSIDPERAEASEPGSSPPWWLAAAALVVLLSAVLIRARLRRRSAG